MLLEVFLPSPTVNMLSMARSAAQRVVLASTGAAARSTVPRAAAVCCYDGALAGSSVGSTSVGATRGVMTKIRRKRIRKKRAREIRALIKYAERYVACVLWVNLVALCCSDVTDPCGSDHVQV